MTAQRIDWISTAFGIALLCLVLLCVWSVTIPTAQGVILSIIGGYGSAKADHDLKRWLTRWYLQQ